MLQSRDMKKQTKNIITLLSMSHRLVSVIKFHCPLWIVFGATREQMQWEQMRTNKTYHNNTYQLQVGCEQQHISVAIT